MIDLDRRLGSLFARFHREEAGAVALLCLAAILILFMCVMIMFDASKATQAKIDVQMGADTAAYSAAATGARSMNMVAFANVGKRTAVGINNMYVYEYDAYKTWVDRMCGCCCTCPVVCCPDITCCLNCSGNQASLLLWFELFDMITYIFGNDLYDNIEELHEFQEAVADVTTAWSAGEAQVRGIRNNANMMAVWPDPNRTDDRYRRLPIELSDHRGESCLAPSPVPGNNPVTAWTAAEWNVNFQVLVDNSTSSPLWAPDGPSEVADGSAHRATGSARTRSMAACMALDWYFPPSGGWNLGYIAQFLMPDEAAPMFVDVDDSSNPWLSGDDQLRMSYMLYSYKHVPRLGRQYRDSYQFMSDDRYNYERADNRMVAGAGGGTGETATFPETGLFGMARSEFYFPPANQPNMIFSGAHEMWLFHPGWMGKLRPVMLPYESTDITSQSWRIEMTDMVGDSMPMGVALAMGIFNISGVPAYDAGGFATDMQYLRVNVARDMIGGGTFGNEYHHYLDGSAK